MLSNYSVSFYRFLHSFVEFVTFRLQNFTDFSPCYSEFLHKCKFNVVLLTNKSHYFKFIQILCDVTNYLFVIKRMKESFSHFEVKRHYRKTVGSSCKFHV